MMKEEEGRCTAAVKAFELAKKKSQELIAKLVEADQDKKSAEAALDVAERQAEAQRKQLRQAEDNLSATRSQIKILTKKLEEDEKAKEQAEQEGYEVDVVETKEALKVEVAEVCRFYCLRVWNEALKQAEVKASSAFRRVENVYYPQAIHTSGSLGSKADSVSSGADEGKESPAKALPAANISSKGAKSSNDAKKAANNTKEGAHDAALPLVVPRVPSMEKEASHSMQIVLATLPIPPKEDLKGKDQASTMAASDIQFLNGPWIYFQML